MAVSIAQQLAKDKYRKEKRDQMTVEVPKGKREVYKLIAAELGISLAQLIQVAVESYGRNHAGGIQLPAAEQKSLSPSDEKLLVEFSKLPVDAQKSLMKFLQTINQKGGGQND